MHREPTSVNKMIELEMSPLLSQYLLRFSILTNDPSSRVFFPLRLCKNVKRIFLCLSLFFHPFTAIDLT